MHPAPAAVGSRRASYDTWPADVAQWVLVRQDEFREAEGVTEEERKEGNEQQ